MSLKDPLIHSYIYLKARMFVGRWCGCYWDWFKLNEPSIWKIHQSLHNSLTPFSIRLRSDLHPLRSIMEMVRNPSSVKQLYLNIFRKTEPSFNYKNCSAITHVSKILNKQENIEYKARFALFPSLNRLLSRFKLIAESEGYTNVTFLKGFFCFNFPKDNPYSIQLYIAFLSHLHDYSYDVLHSWN